jgi:HK97 family phage major capsid protein/HK97 family phage prohead protease
MMETIVTKARVSISDAGEIEGVAWLFGQPDSVGDMIEPGSISFAKSVPMVREHDEGAVVGIWSAFAEDTEKLTVKGSLFVDGIAPARKAREEVKAQKVTGLSLKFMPEKAEPNAHGGRTFKGVIVTEISLCRLPVHPGARITVVKSKGPDMDKNEQGAAPEIAALETKVSELTEQVKGFKAPDLSKIEERIQKMEQKANRPETPKKDEPSEERKAFGVYLRMGDRMPDEEKKALTVSDDPGAGFLAPSEMSQEFIRNLVEFSPIRSVASVRGTSAPSVSYPKRTGATNAKWKGEKQAQEESEPGFGQVEIPVREINTYVDISDQLLEDSATAEAEVRLALSEDFGQKEGLAFVKGSGVLDPEGILTNPDVVHVPTGNASTLGSNPADLLITTMYSLPAAYRARGTWLMNGSTLSAIRKLKDGTTGVYLWQPSYQAGQPELILGRPVIEVPDMDDVGGAAEPIVFGDIATAYRIIDRLNLAIKVNPYIRATEGITRIHAKRRVGGAIVQAAAVKKIRCATT